MSDADFDLVVIGSGPAGERGAVAAANLGARVAMVEKGRMVGGAVANTGTLPSKTLRETALALSGIRARKLYGVDLSLRREATVADFMHHERVVSEHERERIMHNIGGVNVQLFPGRASFVDPHTVRVTPTTTSSGKEVQLKAAKVLIATGSAPFRPPEFPFADPRVHDSDNILTLQRLPHSLAVIGAGTIGCEYACTFTALGTQVQLIDGRDSLLPFLDHEVAHALQKAMERLGITFHWNERVTACASPAQGEVKLTLTSGAVVSVDQVLVAAGRASNTEELNLSAAGITAGKRGLLTVNEHFQTSVEHIYAAGDVIGFPALASTSMEQARVAMFHAFDADFLKSAVSPLLPTGIYTIPEVSMIGETEQTARDKKINYFIGRAHYRENARGQIIGDESGFLKLLFRKDDLTLIGVHVIGELASEVVHIGLMAMLTDSDAQIFNRACFNYPTLGDLYKQATYEMVRTNLRGSILERMSQAQKTGSHA